MFKYHFVGGLPLEPTRVKARVTVFARRYIKVRLITCSASGSIENSKMFKRTALKVEVIIDVAAVIKAITVLVIFL